jgi:hypothetical protein
MDIGAAFVTNAEATKLMQPGICSLDHPAKDAQSASMLRVALGKDGFDAAPSQGLGMRCGMIGAITLNSLRTLAWPSPLARNGRDGIHQRKQLCHIVAIRAGDRRGQWKALRIRDDVMLRAVFPAIRRVGAGLIPPKTARTLELSTTARDQSIWLPSWRWLRNTCRISCHTPASCQSRSRRQQVIPEPQPISLGRSSQAMPVFNTKRIPLRACRCGTAGRPPWGCALSGGRHGSMTAQSSSVSSGLAIVLSSMTNRDRSRTFSHRSDPVRRIRFC